MNKESAKGAAGLRRSALAERIRLREEWSALKETCNGVDKTKNVLAKKPQNAVNNKHPHAPYTYNMRNKDITVSPINGILRGTVVLVDVGSETRALALRAALTALGASVMLSWNQLVTHVVWSQGGCIKTRAKARALACRIVSPIWVESCAASARRLPEKMFPSVSRPSDLPSPATLKKMLKRMDQDNIPLNILSESQEGETGEKRQRLRISSDTNDDTTTSIDTSHDTSQDVSRDKSKDCDAENINMNVNTATRRALPAPKSPAPKKSRRKLFTQKEAEIAEDDSAEETPPPKQKTIKHITREGKKELAKAERIARRLLGTPKNKSVNRNNNEPRIVLTGMSKHERHEMWHAVQKLNGVVQHHVNKRTTHIILGSCREPQTPCITNKQTNSRRNAQALVMCQNCNTPEKILTEMFQNNVTVTKSPQNVKINVVCSCNISGVGLLNRNNVRQETDTSQTILSLRKKSANSKSAWIRNEQTNDNSQSILINSQNRDINESNTQNTEMNQITQLSPSCGENVHKTVSVQIHNLHDQETHTQNVNAERNELHNLFEANNAINHNGQRTDNVNNIGNTDTNEKPRTVNALLGAVRGCRVLYAQWVLDSVKANRWLHHFGYEVPHLLKISQKARIERLALVKMSSEYAYDVFYGMRVKVSEDAEQRDAVKQLLTLCGAITEINENQNGGVTKEGGAIRKYGGLSLKKTAKSQKKELNKTKTHKQDGGTHPQDGGQTFDVTIGRKIGEVASKWVFDSVAAGRMRHTRRYINK